MIENMYFLIGLAYISMFAHFLKKQVKGETVTEIKNYFKDNFKTTLLAIIAVLIGIVTIESLEQLNVVSAIGVGYMCDSVFSKWEGKDPLK